MNTSHMIFVFGSNLVGIHGAGAADFAHRHRGAKWGRGTGFYGQSYALPTKYTPAKTLHLDNIHHYVEEFLQYANNNLGKTFQVTCVGCGLAGLKHEHIAPMFVKASMNCYFDELWEPWLKQAGHRFWGTF